MAIWRRDLADERFETALIGTETRVAGVAADDSLARRRHLRLQDLSSRVIAVSSTTGTTTTDLWPSHAAPQTREIHGIEEWLTAITAGAAVGVTSEATAECPRPGLRYRPIRDAAPIPVMLAWWRDNPPPSAREFHRLVCELYAQR